MTLILRKEHNGGYLFDNITGKIKFVPEKDFMTKTAELNAKKIIPKKLPENYFSAPSKVYFELTRKCNLRCKTCYNSAGTAIKKEIAKNKIFEILNELSSAGTFEVRFTGGEPTIREDFLEITKHAHDLGFFVSVGTNGIWADEYLKKIGDSEINMIIISLEGGEKINDHIRGKGSFKKAIRSIKYLSQNTDKILRINTTIGKYNVNEIETVVKIADEYGIPVINTMPIRPTGRSVNLRNEMLNQEEYLNFVKKIEQIRKKCRVSIQTYFDILGERNRWLENQTSLVNQRSCAAGVEACIIAPSGDVYGCAASNAAMGDDKIREIFIAGNVNNERIMDIWHNNNWRAYRDLKLKISKSCNACKFYTKKCFGNCFVSSYFNTGKTNSPDPYCFAHLLDSKISTTK